MKCAITVTVITVFLLHPLLRDEGTSQNNRQSVTLYPAVHRQTGTKKFSVGDEK